MSREQSESMVFDTSVLVEIVNGSELGARLEPRLKNRAVIPHLTDLNLFELTYLICREEGLARAKAVVGFLGESGFFDVHDAREFLDGAARLKCERSLSIVGCMTIAAGESLEIPVLFARHEREIDAELKKRKFGTEVRFLTDPN